MATLSGRLAIDRSIARVLPDETGAVQTQPSLPIGLELSYKLSVDDWQKIIKANNRSM